MSEQHLLLLLGRVALLHRAHSHAAICIAPQSFAGRVVLAYVCDLIDAIDGPIQNDWSGEIMTKDEAKKYVLEYRA